MAMTLVKQTENYRIYRRGDDRYAVRDVHRRPINGEDKVAILRQEGLVEAPKVKAPEPEPASEPEAADSGVQEGDTASGEDTPSPDESA